MKRPPLPQARGTAAERPMITLTCVVTWPGGDQLTAALQAPSSIEEAEVHWSGAVSRLDEAKPPPSTSACVLSAFLQHQAELTGGTFSEEQSGPWPAIDEVEG